MNHIDIGSINTRENNFLKTMTPRMNCTKGKTAQAWTRTLKQQIVPCKMADFKSSITQGQGTHTHR